MSDYQLGAGQDYNPNRAQEEFEASENAKYQLQLEEEEAKKAEVERLQKEAEVKEATPTTTDKNTDNPIRARVSIAESHSPTIPQYIVPNRTRKPSLIPPNAREGIRSNATINTQDESKRKSSSIQ